MPKKYKSINLPPLNDEQLKEIENLKNMADEDIDTKDIPEATEKEFSSGHFYYANSLKIPKISIHLLIDEDNLDWLKSSGKGYQPRLNNVIRWAKLNNCPIDKM